MEMIAAGASIGQVASYTLSLVVSLQRIYGAVKDGQQFFHDEKYSVSQLGLVISELIESNKSVSASPIAPLLRSIKEAAYNLSVLFEQQDRHKIVLTLLLRRKEIDEAFASLERKKNTLLLHISATNTGAIAEIKTHVLAQRAFTDMVMNSSFDQADP